MTAIHQLFRVTRGLLFAQMSDAFYFYTTNYNKHGYTAYASIVLHKSLLKQKSKSKAQYILTGNKQKRQPPFYRGKKNSAIPPPFIVLPLHEGA